MKDTSQSNELVLSDGEYAYTQDTTSGIIKVHTGPIVVNITGQEYPVVFNTEIKQFQRVPLAEAVMQCPTVLQGHYIELSNPSLDNKQPNEKDKQPAHDLRMGEKVNLPGPCTFSLWPRQHARVIKGHQLRSNEYLIVRIYDEDAARENWNKAVVKRATAKIADGKATDKKSEKGEETTTVVASEKVPDDLSVGKLIIIKGTEISFFIPPTGMEVLPDRKGNFVREAITLERLQYCILVDENGNKDYQRGPQVVFPKPTEKFFEQDGQKIFKPIELNEIQGLHVKVIADYEENGHEYKEGDELFITGEDTPIYFPRQEHSLVSYGEQAKHYATAIPSGEARYLMERTSGGIKTISGPTMLLPDPRKEVIVRRVLSAKKCQLWYPGNTEALAYNANLRKELGPEGPQGPVGAHVNKDMLRSRDMTKSARRKLATSDIKLQANAISDTDDYFDDEAYLAIQNAPEFLADQFKRGTSYTKPRTITIDTKYAGVPSIDVWTGYAVMVVSKSGDRRVELGPKTILLGYDESLEVLEMSTGKPKNTDRKLQTVYLRVTNNQVSDVVYAETKDHVAVEVKLSHRVNFEGDNKKWFDAENYIKLLCDHIRSILKGYIRKLPIEEFYADPTACVRDALLGQKAEDKDRTGMIFNENGMRLVDVEVLNVKIGDDDIAALLQSAQHEAVQSAIELANAERELSETKTRERLSKERLDAQADTERHRTKLEEEKISRDHALSIVRTNTNIEMHKKTQEETDLAQAVYDLKQERELGRKKKEHEVDHSNRRALAEITANTLKIETDNVVRRFDAAKEGLSDALVAASQNDTMARLAEAGSFQTFIGGKNFAEVFSKMFENTPFKPTFDKISERAVQQIRKDTSASSSS